MKGLRTLPGNVFDTICSATALHGSAALPFVIPSVAEGSAVTLPPDSTSVKRLTYLQNILVFRRLGNRALRKLARYLEELTGVLVPLSGKYYRQSVVSSVAYLRVELNRPQERQIALLG